MLDEGETAYVILTTRPFDGCESLGFHLHGDGSCTLAGSMPIYRMNEWFAWLRQERVMVLNAQTYSMEET